MRVQAAPQEHFAWLQQATGCALTSDFTAIEALWPDGRIAGMVGYCNWTENCVELHIASKSLIVGRALVGPALEYPFRQVGVGIALGIVHASNKRSCRWAKVMGFREIYRIRDGARKGEDRLVFELRREAWEEARPLIRRAA